MVMTKVTLLLAKGPGLPEGDLADRLMMTLCLTAKGQMDVSAYDTAPEPWLATRDHGGDPKTLEIVRLDEGWALQSTTSMDDPIWTFEGHVFRPGELVRLQRPDGEELLFRIVASEAAAPPP